MSNPKSMKVVFTYEDGTRKEVVRRLLKPLSSAGHECQSAEDPASKIPYDQRESA